MSIDIVQVWIVTYTRRDGVAVAPIVCTDATYAGTVAAVLLGPHCHTVDSVTITRRPPIGGEM